MRVTGGIARGIQLRVPTQGGVRPATDYIREAVFNSLGSLGVVEGVLIPTLVGFGLTRSEATLGVLSYRFAQYWFPMLLGAVMYASLRFGPWSIKRRERLKGLRELAAETDLNRESALDFAARFGELVHVQIVGWHDVDLVWCC